jgi:hypothetical protein
VQSHLAVDGLDRLRQRLLESHCQSIVSEEGLDAIDALQQRIAATAASNDVAIAGLEAMVALRDRVQNEAAGVETAQERAEQLIDLKNRVLDRTGNLAAATENLELMIDIQEQFGRVSQSFGRMRQWLVEIVAFEPTFNRAMRSLQPLLQLGNLRHMNASQLREVVRTMNEGPSRQEWATAPSDDATAPETATHPEVAVDAAAQSDAGGATDDAMEVPAIVESARAN